MSLDGMDGEARFYSKYTTLTVIQVLALAIKTKLKNNHCCRVLKILNNQDMISGMGALNTIYSQGRQHNVGVMNNSGERPCDLCSISIIETIFLQLNLQKRFTR